MDTPFPFGFPAPTAFYLVLFVVTLIVHVVLMNYVLAGTAVLAVSGLRGGLARPNPLAGILGDWLPFALSGAITAAIAPLLFVQILYRQPFYTANLLLFNRWMAMLPVLIVGFYLLYVLKAPRFEGRWPRTAAALGAAVCFLFAAWSWTENSLLTLAGDQWAGFYQAERIVHWEPALLPRLGMWIFGALPTMALVCLLQIANSNRGNRNLETRYGPDAVTGTVRLLAWLALAGLAAAVACGLIYAAVGDLAVRSALTGPLGRWYLLLGLVGAAAQFALWWGLVRDPTPRRLAPLTLATLATIAGMTVFREAVRLHALDLQASLQPYFDQHAVAAGRGGFVAFLVFAALNVGLASLCVWIVRTGRRQQVSN